MTDQNLAAVELATGVVTALGSVPAILGLIKSWSDRRKILVGVTETDAELFALLPPEARTRVTSMRNEITDLETRLTTAETRLRELEEES